MLGFVVTSVPLEWIAVTRQQFTRPRSLKPRLDLTSLEVTESALMQVSSAESENDCSDSLSHFWFQIRPAG